jgi:hypothetical protein
VNFVHESSAVVHDLSAVRHETYRTLAKTVRQHWEGILAYFHSGLTSAPIEAINGVIQLAKRIAPGFKSFVYFQTAAYLPLTKEVRLPIPHFFPPPPYSLAGRIPPISHT